MNQSQYIRQKLLKFGYEGLKPVATPLDPKHKLMRAGPDEPAVDVQRYQEIIGCLIYLVSCTRPDLAHAVSVLSQFNSYPTESHHAALKRCCRYLSGTRTHGLFYPKSKSLNITAYSDAAYGNCFDTYRSWSGYAFFLGDSCISWISKKQNSVAMSTTEAEYMSLSVAARQAIWYLHGSQELGLTIPITVRCDNTSAISISNNPIVSNRSKHIAIHYHFVRESVITKSLN